jgi:uncharacterized membrane protein
VILKIEILIENIYCLSKGFRVISQAKLRDMSIREKLKKHYSDVDHCLKKFDDISILNEDNEDFSKIHNGQKERLDNPDYHLLVAGNWHFFNVENFFYLSPLGGK